MKVSSLLIFLIGFSLAIQNTCPFGLAARTGFASPLTHCCCAKKAAEDSGNADKNGKQAVAEKGPVFVFTTQGKALPSPLPGPQTTCSTCPDNFYRSIVLNPPEEPPRIS